MLLCKIAGRLFDCGWFPPVSGDDGSSGYLRERTGLLPVSVIEKPIDKRMASTVRHNRARGTHDVDLMSNIVKELHEFGRSDAWISKHLGMDRDEILRLKQITGLAALFRDIKFGEAWRPVEEETAKE